MKKCNVGIVGYGWAAEAHIAAINATSNGQVTAICSSRPLDPAELSAKHQCPLKVFHQLDHLLADRCVDVVDICSYHDLHVRQAIAAARAGKHLIIEKPRRAEPEGLPAMLAAVKQARVKTCVCFELRWSAQFQATRSLLELGLLGDVHYGRWITTTASVRGIGNTSGSRRRKPAGAACSPPVVMRWTRFCSASAVTSRACQLGHPIPASDLPEV